MELLTNTNICKIMIKYPYNLITAQTSLDVDDIKNTVMDINVTFGGMAKDKKQHPGVNTTKIYDCKLQ